LNASPLHPIGTKPGSLSTIMQIFQSFATRKINQIRKTPGENITKIKEFREIQVGK